MHGRFDDDVTDSLASLMNDGWITELLYEVKSGKEATVYCCRAGDRVAEGGGDLPGDACPSAGRMLVAAKVHRSLETRRFKNDAIYQTGRVHLAREGRAKRAADNKSAFGREVQYAMWIEHEWETLTRLSRAGLDVPHPIARNDRAILMSFLGDASTSAPNLVEANVPRRVARAVFNRIMDNVEVMLDMDLVHGDLSPYNILWWNGEATIIDFPQAVDPRLNPAARTLLARDVSNLCAWAAKHGVQTDPRQIEHDLWRRFRLGELG